MPADRGEPRLIPVGPGAALLALADAPLGLRPEPRGLVLVVHGLGGSSEREGVRRLGLSLQIAGWAVRRLNLRGAGPGRPLAPGTYAARCDADLWPVLRQARQEAAGRPLVGVGISLGGTVLLNALLAQPPERQEPGGLDALVCTSSPMDLAACARQIERPRNRIYQRWLLRRLCAQTLADPFGVSAAERSALVGPNRPRTIRAFDAAITAPRWGYRSVEHYYREASPAVRLLAPRGVAEGDPAPLPSPWRPPLPPTLLLQALDDPWVPACGARALAAGVEEGRAPRTLEVVLTARGGHSGFHGVGDDPLSCWGDQLVVRWLDQGFE